MRVRTLGRLTRASRQARANPVVARRDADLLRLVIVAARIEHVEPAVPANDAGRSSKKYEN